MLAARPHGVERRERDAVELDRERPRRRDRVGDHRVVIAAHVVHASPSCEYARTNSSYCSSEPRSVRSPFTTTASGSSASISAIAPAFITLGYGGSPGLRVQDRAELLGVRGRPHSTSPKCTSLTVAKVASCRPGGRASVVTCRREQLRRLGAVDGERIFGLGLQAGDPGGVIRAGRRDLVIAGGRGDRDRVVGAERHHDLVGPDGEQLGVVDHRPHPTAPEWQA